MQALLQPHIANLQVLHNEQYGVNITWEYLDGDTAAGHAVGGNVTFTVQFYKLLIDPRCCGPHPTTCTRITQRWCTVRGLDDSDGYHFQVISEQGSYHSNVSSVGFFLNGNNGKNMRSLFANYAITAFYRHGSLVAVKELVMAALYDGGYAHVWDRAPPAQNCTGPKNMAIYISA